MTKIKTYSGKQLVRSTKTRLVQSILGYDIYSHTIRGVAGHFVVVFPESVHEERDWEAFETFQDAKRKVVHELPH